MIGQDERLLGMCAYCGGAAETVDHVPPKVLLDEPFPPMLRTVHCCLACNNAVSSDELYVACLVESVVCGTTDPEKIERAKIARKLCEEPALAARIATSRYPGHPPTWNPECVRVNRVVRKLAQGHAAWELTLPALGAPHRVDVLPLQRMTESQRAIFEMQPSGNLWPEGSSRAFYRAIEGDGNPGWEILQEGRYRYSVDRDEGVRHVRRGGMDAAVACSRLKDAHGPSP